MATERPFGSLTGNAGFLLSRVGTAVQTGFKELLGGWRIRPQQFAILLELTEPGQAAFAAMTEMVIEKAAGYAA